MRAFGPFRLDTVNHCLWHAQERAPLTPKAFDVLRYLVEHADRLVTHEELLAALWPETYINPEGIRKYNDRISFTIYPNARWRNKYESGEEAGGLTKLIFVGTVQGSEIKFTLIWDSVTLYGKPPVGKEFLLRATRTAE